MSRRNKEQSAYEAQEKIWQQEDAEDAVSSARERERARVLWLTVGPAVVLVIAGIVLAIVSYASAWPDRMAAAGFGIVNDQKVNMILADSVSETYNVHGAVFFFAGSITGASDETLRMGYTSPNGNSYIVHVPIDHVIFHKDPQATSEASFHFNYWSEYYEAPLQNNIDSNLQDITVNLTPEEFQQLVKSN